MKRVLIAALASCGLFAAYAEDIGVTYDANGDATVAAGGEITVGPSGASTNNSQGVTVTFEGGGTIKAIKTDNNGAVQSYHRLWRDYFINGTVTYDGSELASGTAPSFRRSVIATNGTLVVSADRSTISFGSSDSNRARNYPLYDVPNITFAAGRGTIALDGEVTLRDDPGINSSGITFNPNKARLAIAGQGIVSNRTVWSTKRVNFDAYGSVIYLLDESYIPEGVTPSYFLYLDVNPQTVDVNIHPTKTEIKFEDDSVIFQTLYACIKEALGKNSFGDSIDFDREGIPELPALGKNFDEFRPVSEPVSSIDMTFNPFDNDGLPSEGSPFSNTIGNEGFTRQAPVEDFGGFSSYNTARFVEKRDDYGKLFEDKVSTSKPLIILQGKYIITSARSGMMVINITRALERIMYDRFLDALSKNGHITQTVLFPVTVHVGVENICLFEEHAPMLSALGFDIAPFGIDTIVVNGVPEGYSAESGKIQTMIGDLLLVLSEDYSALPEMMTANMASRLARIGSLSGDPVTNPTEAQRLIDTLLACENAEYTNSGKRIITVITTDEIDKRFN